MPPGGNDENPVLPAVVLLEAWGVEQKLNSLWSGK
jgi:hypothetical protein